jgi:hypothetical protein
MHKLLSLFPTILTLSYSSTLPLPSRADLIVSFSPPAFGRLNQSACKQTCDKNTVTNTGELFARKRNAAPASPFRRRISIEISSDVHISSLFHSVNVNKPAVHTCSKHHLPSRTISHIKRTAAQPRAAFRAGTSMAAMEGCRKKRGVHGKNERSPPRSGIEISTDIHIYRSDTKN